MEEKQPSEPKRRGGTWPLLAVQSVSCAVVVILLLAFRLLTNDLFLQLRVYFQEAIQQNALAAAIHALWEDESLYTTAATVPSTTVTIAPTEPTAVQTLPSAAAVGGEAATAPCAVAAWRGEAIDTMPVTGAVLTSPFGWRDDPFTGSTAFHRGVDLAVPLHTPIAAMWAGEITAADDAGTGSLGKHLRLRRTDGIEVLYAHCETITVCVGDTVSAGDTVATVGSTGRSTGVHLHLQLEQDGVLYDPLPLLTYAFDT